ncbi:MAG: transposase, partial [Planctomycetales bacterium]
MAWALWQDEQHRGVKLHLHFDVLAGTPRQATVTPAACSETAELKATLETGQLYVTDRGYQDYALFRQIIDADSSFVGRVKDNIAYV